ncbi:hypothetical protein V1527DRAFT_479923 [Lipomyces starkeyi]
MQRCDEADQEEHDLSAEKGELAENKRETKAIARRAIANQDRSLEHSRDKIIRQARLSRPSLAAAAAAAENHDEYDDDVKQWIDAALSIVLGLTIVLTLGLRTMRGYPLIFAKLLKNIAFAVQGNELVTHLASSLVKANVLPSFRNDAVSLTLFGEVSGQYLGPKFNHGFGALIPFNVPVTTVPTDLWSAVDTLVMRIKGAATAPEFLFESIDRVKTFIETLDLSTNTAIQHPIPPANEKYAPPRTAMGQ